ncbi:hypothetical protein ABZ352_18415 [Streptomyces griseofuscus]|uniref:hypothetical protein n=1 Tax=Streptomyces griseofuscus TaxID=146922 RepID=UPI0034096B54
MNPPKLPPLPGYQAPRRRILRDLLGLLLVGAGTVGLLGVLYAAEPLVALALVGLVLVAGGATVLFLSPPLPRVVRLIAGYCALSLGLWLLIGLACYLTPWSLLFGLVLAVGVLLSSSEGE